MKIRDRKLLAMMFDTINGFELLRKADVFFEPDEDDGLTSPRVLNLNDTWSWGCADCEDVPEEEIPALATLFWRYGNCGILYWVSERRGQCRSDFTDINRMIEFVRNEEQIRAELPDSSQRAYGKRTYTIHG